MIDPGAIPTVTISGFAPAATNTAPSDIIDVRGIGTATGYTIAPDGTLRLYAGSPSNTLATLHLDPSVAASLDSDTDVLDLVSDGAAGTAAGTALSLTQRIFNFNNETAAGTTNDQYAALFDIGGADALPNEVYNLYSYSYLAANNFSVPVDLAAGSVLNFSGELGTFALQSGMVTLNNVERSDNGALNLEGGTLQIENNYQIYYGYFADQTGITISGAPTILFTPGNDPGDIGDIVYGINDTAGGGQGSIIVDGPGIVVLEGTGSFAEPITLDQGTSLLRRPALPARAASRSPPTAGDAVAGREPGVASLNGVIYGFAPGDVLGLSDRGARRRRTVVLGAHNALSFDGANFNLDPNQNFAGDVFKANYSSSYTTLSVIVQNPTVSTEAQLDVALNGIAAPGYTSVADPSYTLTLAADFTGANALTQAAIVGAPAGSSLTIDLAGHALSGGSLALQGAQNVALASQAGQTDTIATCSSEAVVSL